VSQLAERAREKIPKGHLQENEVNTLDRADADQTTETGAIGKTIRLADDQGAEPRLRVLHVIDRLGVGGTEYGIAKVIQGLSGNCFEHRICALRGFDQDFVRAQGFEGKVCVAGGSSAGFQFLLGRLARIMRRFRPHIVHSRNWGAIEAIPAARLAGVPVAIHSEHGYEVDMLAGLPKRRRIIRRSVYAVADAVFTVTEELRAYHARQAWFSAERIRVLPNGVDTARFKRRSEEREEIRRRLGLSGDCMVLGSVGRMVPIKDHQTLLQAAENLGGRGIAVRLLLAGSGPELQRYQQFANGSAELSERVVFVGSTKEVPALLNALDIFVLPSLSEGMSNTLLEAMASSLPVVATNVGGNPELVEDGRSGWLFQPGDVSGLTAKLERLTKDPNLRQALGQAARNRAVEEFSLERMIDRYRELYLDLARERNLQVALKG
jgi:sugar transferase (PEP-CTERM/EpsH1 system associated)